MSKRALVVTLRGDADVGSAVEALEALGLEVAHALAGMGIVTGVAPEEAVAAIARHPAVESVEDDREAFPS